jgi:beta-lactamase class A
MKKPLIFCLILLTSQIIGKEAKMKLSDLKQNLTEVIQNGHGDYALAFKNMQNGEHLLIREKESFHAASLHRR